KGVAAAGPGLVVFGVGPSGLGAAVFCWYGAGSRSCSSCCALRIGAAGRGGRGIPCVFQWLFWCSWARGRSNFEPVSHLEAPAMQMQMMQMAQRNTVIRGLHDLGLAAWFGGCLMGAVGLNKAAEQEADRLDESIRISGAGWDKWAPLNLAAIGAHLLGGAGLLGANRERVMHQKGVAASTIAKTAVTAAALGATAYSRMLGRRAEEAA